ncbi:MAG: sulfatase [Bacteroidota bacterium]|nr:sulfatase [Bacteroidota bacterium]
MILYSLCRILFLLFNLSHFPGLSFSNLISVLFYGLYFDASTVAMLNLFYIFLFLLPLPFRSNPYYNLLLKWIFVIINSIGLLANCADLVYFQFTIKRTTADVFNFFHGGMGNDLGRLLPVFFKDYWYVFLIWAVLIFLLIRWYNRTEKKEILQWDLKQYGIQFLQLVLFTGFFILIYRGGFQLRPIGIVNAGEYTESKYVPLVLNTPFSIIKTIEVEGLEPHIYFQHPEETGKYINPYHPADTGAFRKLNVVIIALESFSKEYVGALNPGRPTYTPFLDSLIAESYTCTNAFSNGKKSIEGIPAIIAGIPSWSNEPFITSRYGNNQINSLADLLKTEGYTSAFFHGGTNGTMGFDAFAGLAGFDDYYGRSEYDNEKHFDGHWGIWDEEYLQYTAGEINKKAEPFFASVFTLTSHHPYEIPERYKEIFKEGPLEIHKTIRYTDNALRRFFETASKMSWFKNTLFVLAADHTGISHDPFYTTRLGNFAIPIIYYLPGSGLKGLDSTVTQQIDIMPSVLDYLNYNKPYFGFGNSVFDKHAKHYWLGFSYECYQMYEGEYVSQFADNRKTNLYHFSTDSLCDHDINLSEPVITNYMENKTKAILQSYEQSIINNKMH